MVEWLHSPLRWRQYLRGLSYVRLTELWERKHDLPECYQQVLKAELDYKRDRWWIHSGAVGA